MKRSGSGFGAECVECRGREHDLAREPRLVFNQVVGASGVGERQHVVGAGLERSRHGKAVDLLRGVHAGLARGGSSIGMRGHAKVAQ